MSSRLLIKGKKYGVHQIEKKDGYGYDAKTLERLDSTMTKSLREAECPSEYQEKHRPPARPVLLEVMILNTVVQGA